MTKTFTRPSHTKTFNVVWIGLLKNLSSLVVNVISSICLWMITFYRGTISYFFGPCCRFYPSCSEYSTQAFKHYSPIKAFYLTAIRILRCHPFGGSGYDPLNTQLSRGKKI